MGVNVRKWNIKTCHKRNIKGVPSLKLGVITQNPIVYAFSGFSLPLIDLI